MQNLKPLHLIGYACGLGARQLGAKDGPLKIQQSSYLKTLSQENKIIWDSMIQADESINSSKIASISHACEKLADEVNNIVEAKQFFGVIGGDHSCAIGTWSGFSHAWRTEGPVGLIWVDAHMDSHTSETTPSGNVHGMPVASLLGKGATVFSQILNKNKKIFPENMCLIGIRSFEDDEAKLLKEMNVRVFFMEEIKEKGLETVMKEAIKIVTQQTVAFGISIDIDSMTPDEVPGTGTPVPDGIPSTDLFHALQFVTQNAKFAGFEIAEFDPNKDQNERTEKIVTHLIDTLMQKKNSTPISATK